MPVLYIANRNYSSWSLRPWVLMKALAMDFEERFVPFLEGSSYEKFRAFSPTGLVPCLVDGETVVWESLAITEYLAEAEPRVWPSDKAARAWARSASAEMHADFSALRTVCTMNVGVKVRLFEMSPPLQKDIDRLDELWSEGLERFGGPFLAGSEFTAVDAFFAPVAFRVRTYDLALSDPARAYAQRLLDLPAMREWETAALAETMRETEHEAEIPLVGELIEDRRVAPA